jgi:hypothetical protein
MLLTYFLNDIEIVPVAPIITAITFVFTFHMRCISIVRSLYFKIINILLLLLLLVLLNHEKCTHISEGTSVKVPYVHREKKCWMYRKL